MQHAAHNVDVVLRSCMNHGLHLPVGRLRDGHVEEIAKAQKDRTAAYKAKLASRDGPSG